LALKKWGVIGAFPALDSVIGTARINAKFYGMILLLTFVIVVQLILIN
jgi:hypothetical protein